MKLNVRSSYPRPSTEERWLLAAATQPKDIAQAAWGRWRASCRLETVEPRSQALFGMVYANLVRDLGGPDASLLKGAYRQTWYADQLVFRALRPLLDRLETDGIPALLLNDASLAGGGTIRTSDIARYAASTSSCPARTGAAP